MDDRRIRISTQQDAKGGHIISVSDADTGELIPEIASVLIRVDRNDLVVADIKYSNSAIVWRSPVEEISVVISSDVLSIKESIDRNELARVHQYEENQRLLNLPGSKADDDE